MTTEIEETVSPTSTEDKFFGISTTVGDDKSDTDDGDDKIEIVVADKEAKPVDPELTGYSDKVQKRIDKLTWQAKEAERQRAAAQAENIEAIRYAKGVAQQNQQYEDVISKGEARLIEQIKAKANLAVAQAQAKYKQAYEAGDTDAIIAAQTELINAQAENRSAGQYDAEYQNRVHQWTQAKQQQAHQQHLQQQAYLAQQRQRQQQPQQSQQPAVAPPSRESATWADENPWFGSPKHRDMTAIAYAKHETLIRDMGVKPDSDDYYREINTEVRKHFPDYFADNRRQSARPNTVVATGSRSGTANPRKQTLSPSQVSIAKKLGVSLERYAKQVSLIEGGKK